LATRERASFAWFGREKHPVRWAGRLHWSWYDREIEDLDLHASSDLIKK